MTALVEDCAEARMHGLLANLRAAEADFRRSYARVLSVVAELDAERAEAVAGFGSTARLLSGVLNLPKVRRRLGSSRPGSSCSGGL